MWSSGKLSQTRNQGSGRVYDARLIVARLDRLARGTAMIAGLMDSGVDFAAADMPLANRFTIHILAAVAEYEARLISERTKAAFAAAEARGRKFGKATTRRLCRFSVR
jgi:DNA invertase Pin-like site-specific DNA recombinase